MAAREIARVLFREAAQLLRAGDLKGAEAVLQRLETEDPLSVHTRGLRLEYLIEAGRTADAGTLATQLLDLYPGSARVQLLAGRLAYGAREYKNALHHFQESNRLHPAWRTQRDIGRALTQLGNLDEAEAILVSLLPGHPICHRDLAWLYERRGDPERALDACETYLRAHPDDPLAKSQQLRLRARMASPEDLAAEVDSMVELGEPVSPDLIPEFVEKLFRTGESEKARAFVRAQRDELDDRVKTRIAWVAYRLQAYDVAVDLFLDVFTAQCRDPKYINALETAAARTAQLERVEELYAAHAADDPRLHGRIKRLQRR